MEKDPLKLESPAPRECGCSCKVCKCHGQSGKEKD